MSKILVITEKFSQAKALRAGLRQNIEVKTYSNSYNKSKNPNLYYEGDSTIIVPAHGHLFELYDIPDYLEGTIQKNENGKTNWREFADKIPYIPETFKYKLKSGWEKGQFELIKKLINRDDVEKIYNFGDPDAEGELLIREILIHANNTKPVERIETKSLVPSEIANEYYHPYNSNNYTYLYFEALARQQTDWLTGINFTVMLTLKSGVFFPVGRVLVPIVRYVYNKVNEHENFVPEISYGINLILKRDKKKYIISSSQPEISFAKDEKLLCDKLKNELQNGITVVTKVEKKKKNFSPKKLYSTSKILGDMSSKYGLSMDMTTKALQILYEDARIMYPRTDCEYLQTCEIDNTRKTIEGLISAGYPLKFHTKKSVFDDKKCGEKGEGGHTAIIITNKFFSDSEFEALQPYVQAVYLAIFNRTISNFCDPPDVDETTVTLKNGDYTFKIKGNVVNSQGFFEFEPRALSDELPYFAEGEVIKGAEFETVQRKTKAPPMPTNKNLTKYLENPNDNYNADLSPISDTEELNGIDEEHYYEKIKNGATIGTPSTIGPTVTKAIRYGYITETKGTLNITKKGKALIETLDRLDLHNLDANRTVELNKTIKQIGKKVYTLEQNKQAIKNELWEASKVMRAKNIVVSVDDLREPTETVGKCPYCGSPVYVGKNSYYCGNKECKFYLYKEDSFFKNVLGNKTITKTQAKGFLSSNRQAKVTSIKSKKKFDENGKPKVYDAIITVDFEGGKTKFSFGEFAEKKKIKKGGSKK